MRELAPLLIAGPMRDSPWIVRASLVRAHSVTSSMRRRDDLAAHGKHTAGLADRVLDVPGDARHRDDE